MTNEHRARVCLKACEGISTYALEHNNVVAQMFQACAEALQVMTCVPMPQSRAVELLESRLRLVIARATEQDPEVQYARDNLPPCPFCGAKAHMNDISRPGHPFNPNVRAYFVKCTKCLAESRATGTEESAIAAWALRT